MARALYMDCHSWTNSLNIKACTNVSKKGDRMSYTNLDFITFSWISFYLKAKLFGILSTCTGICDLSFSPEINCIVLSLPVSVNTNIQSISSALISYNVLTQVVNVLKNLKVLVNMYVCLVSMVFMI